MSQKSTISTISTIINIFASPGEAFASIKEKPRYLVALLLLLLGGALVQFFYMKNVDVQWFFDELAASNPNTTQQQIDGYNAFASLPQTVVAVIFSVITAIFIPIFFLIVALYFKIVSQFTKDGLSYKQLFSLVCLSSIPSLLASLASLVKVMTSDVSLMPATELNPLAFWGLLNLESMGAGTFDGIAMNTDPTTIWSLVLLILGYKIFSGKDLGTAALIALIPTAVIFGLAFAF